MVPCVYSDVGCEDSVKRKDLPLHCAQKLDHHLQLAMAVVRTLRTPVATFKLKDFSALKSGKRWWYSGPFYSSEGGYKLCLGVMASGHGDGKGTHISVYVYRMRGENDDQLEWPFRGQVTFELLNQLEDSAHVARTVPFDFQVSNEFNSRVVKGERSGQGWGFNRLLSHDQLLFPSPSSTAQTAGGHNIAYLKDDCLFFRVTEITVFESNRPWLIATHNS